MSYKESDIVHENLDCFVLKEKDCYTVFVSGVTHSKSDSSYAKDEDGLSLATIRCNYLADSKTAYRHFRLPKYLQ